MTDLISALQKEIIGELYLATMNPIDVHLGCEERAFQFFHLCAPRNRALGCNRETRNVIQIWQSGMTLCS